MKKLISSIVLAVLCSTPLLAADLGDPAKPLDIQEWVKGSAVNLADGKGKTIYVVEFWATWCPPCRASIPHLTELQKKFKDKGVVFIGVTDEKSDVVKKFVTSMADKMDYTVAIDGGKTSEGYMQAYGINGIPHAFIVDKEGKIAWEGHPMAGLDKVLDEIIAGKYDMNKAKEEAKKEATTAKRMPEVQKKLQQYAQAIAEGDESEETKKLEAELLALDKELGGIMNGEKFDPADFRQRVMFKQKLTKYQRAIVTGSDADELATLEKDIVASAPKDFSLPEFKQQVAYGIESRNAVPVLKNYIKSVGENGDAAKAAELAKQIEGLELKNPQLLNQVAWMILDEDTIKNRDTKLALNLAKRAVDFSESKNPQYVDTYARALFDNGKTADAIEQQKKAIELADDDNLKAELKKSLEKYEAKSKDTAKAP
jgi:thiol-disulfide isomerase/thioredoxin